MSLPYFPAGRYPEVSGACHSPCYSNCAGKSEYPYKAMELGHHA
jgi:hypothetical protein